jgi:hypothetical protein
MEGAFSLLRVRSNYMILDFYMYVLKNNIENIYSDSKEFKDALEVLRDEHDTELLKQSQCILNEITAAESSEDVAEIIKHSDDMKGDLAQRFELSDSDESDDDNAKDKSYSDFDDSVEADGRPALSSAPSSVDKTNDPSSTGISTDNPVTTQASSDTERPSTSGVETDAISAGSGDEDEGRKPKKMRICKVR